MPLVSEHIDSGRRSIEKELKELLKLYRWEQDPGSYASIENFRRTKQKMLKSVQKFILENNSNQPSRSFLQPSYNVVHLLEVSPAQPNVLLDNRGDQEWTLANNYYFKCLAMMQQLQLASLSFSKDLDLEQVNRALSFVDHLINVLCEQRNIAYCLSERLINLRKRLLNFTGESDNSSIAPSQNDLFKCMQQQKLLFDNLLTMSRDVTLLLGSFKNSHLSTCDTVGDEAATLSSFVDNFMPTFIKSKELLDKSLIGGSHVLAPLPKHIPDVVTNEMKQLVDTNQQIINTFDDGIKKLGFQKHSTRSVKEMLLGRFQELINKHVVGNYGSRGMQDCSTTAFHLARSWRGE